MMKLGIVAEYNPFHNGHEFQIKYARYVIKAEEIIVLMSGNFTQRGLPAICDKNWRARAAICAGATSVLEMPVEVATADTPMFAQGAVDILLQNGCNALLFGSERDNLDELKLISQIVSKDEYWDIFEKNKKKGASPDDARIAAIKELSDTWLPDYSFVNEPNNLLGIYYLCGLRRRNASIEVYTNKRMGQSYFEEEMPKDSKVYASATSVRKKIKQCIYEGDFSFHALEPYLPIYMIEGLVKAFNQEGIAFQEDFGELYLHAINHVDKEMWRHVCPMIDHEVVKESIRQGDDFKQVREKCLQYVAELKLDRMLTWILLKKPQPSLKDFLVSDHVGWQVIVSRKFYELPGSQFGSEDLKKSWDDAEQIYAMRHGRSRCGIIGTGGEF